MQSEAWHIPTEQSDLDLPAKTDVRINDTAAVVVAEGDTARLTAMRWSFPPARPGGAPVFNFRSEGRSFANSRRCLIPASAFFEFTAPDDPKQKRKDKWRFTRTDGDLIGIAALWRPAERNHPPTFTMLTCEPGPDVAPIHNRQIVVLPAHEWRPWLHLTKPEYELLRPSPADTFSVARE
jgi:putative SOS response-associated peptidase YedK